MIRRLILLSVLLVGLQTIFSSGASAQSSGCSQLITAIWYWPDAVLPGWFYVGPGQGPFSYRIGTWGACAQAEACLTCPKGGSPISFATGNTYIQQTDVRVPGLSNGLSLVRTWNSLWPVSELAFQTGIFGPNWRCNFEERVFLGSDGLMRYSRGDGSYWSFQQGVSLAAVMAPSNGNATLSSGASYWTISYQSGEQRRFDNASGSLIAIIDRNGNQTQLSYDGTHRLVTITDPVSRHLYFNYANSSFPNLVTSITSDISLTLSYAYDTQGRLTQVTRPDLSTLNFAYNAQSLITSVTDSQGKVLESHTYDSTGRGLTSAQANGVNAVTVAYPNQ